MDIKIGGLTRAIMSQALEQARDGAAAHPRQDGRGTIATPRAELSTYAPRISTIKIKPDQIRDIIGPGGKIIRGIVEETGVKIDVEDDGTVYVASADGDAMQKALDRIRGLTAEAEVGTIYHGTVRKIVDFGAFVEILPGTDGLVHISELADERVRAGRPTSSRRATSSTSRSSRSTSRARSACRARKRCKRGRTARRRSTRPHASRTRLPNGVRVVSEDARRPRLGHGRHLGRERLALRAAASRPASRTSSSTSSSRAPSGAPPRRSRRRSTRSAAC